MKKILAACNPAVPTEDLVVRILVGSGLRREELCGLAVAGPDCLSDVMTDSLGSGRVELRVRWNAGGKGRKSRRVPITPKLAAAIKRYEARHRRDTDLPQLLINGHGNPYQGPGIKSMMDRLTERNRLPDPRPCVPAHLRHGGSDDGLELRASASSDGPLGLRSASALRAPGHGTRPGLTRRLGRADHEQSSDRVVLMMERNYDFGTLARVQ